MKKKVPGHGRSRDEGPAGRAGPRRISNSQPSSHSSFYTPDLSKDFAIRPNPSLSREVSGAACCFSIDFLYEKSRLLNGALAGDWRLDFYLHREFGRGRDRILSTQRTPGGSSL